MMKIYGDRLSGNCYKLTLACSILKIEHEWIPIDILKGETKTSSFLIKNPNGKIPLLELRDGEFLSESNAILNFLSHGTSLLPENKFELYKVQQWQFFEQYSHEPYIAVARFINKYLGMPDDRKEEFHAKQTGGNKALSIMENQLSYTPYLVGNTFTTADISLFAYTHVAEEGGFELSKYPNILNWITRIRSYDGFLEMI